MNEKTFRLFVDLDGVVADWLGRAIDSFGINTKNPTVRQILSTDVRGLEQLIDPDFMWRVIDAGEEQWWHEIKLFSWSQYLISELELLSPGNVCFLTQPGKQGTSAHGKSDWIRKHFGTEQFLLGAPKHFCANRYSFLIDDSPWKIDKFNQAGGHGILFPNSFAIQAKEQGECADKSVTIRVDHGKATVNSLLSVVRDIMSRINNEDRGCPSVAGFVTA